MDEESLSVVLQSSGDKRTVCKEAVVRVYTEPAICGQSLDTVRLRLTAPKLSPLPLGPVG